MVQVLVPPFQRSAKVSVVPDPSWYWPTAMQAMADGQDTPANELDSAPAGLGVDWTVQVFVLPFQRSAKVTEAPEIRYWPTAVQAVAEVHDTPNRRLDVAPAGTGTDWTTQMLPLKRAAKAIGTSTGTL